MLKEALHYNPETGVFRWISKASHRVKMGEQAGWKNTRSGYRYLRLVNRVYAEHELAFLYMQGELPQGKVEHINGDRSDNRFANLRVTPVGNLAKNNTSGYTGVSWFQPRRKWQAKVQVGGERKHLGYFDDKEEAINVIKAIKEATNVTMG